jgi:hypothetical protein
MLIFGYFAGNMVATAMRRRQGDGSMQMRGGKIYGSRTHKIQRRFELRWPLDAVREGGGGL